MIALGSITTPGLLFFGPGTHILSGTGSWQPANFSLGDPFSTTNGAIVALASDLTLNVSGQTFISAFSTLNQNGRNLTINGGIIHSRGVIDLGSGALNLNANRLEFLNANQNQSISPGLKGTGAVNLTATGAAAYLGLTRMLFQPAFHMLSGAINAEFGPSERIDRSLMIDGAATFNFNSGSVTVNGDITVDGTLAKTSPAGTSTTLIFNGSTLTNNGSIATGFLNFNRSGGPLIQSIAGTGAWPNGARIEIGSPLTPSITTLLNDVTINYNTFGIAAGSRLETGAFTLSMPCSTAWSSAFGVGEFVGNLRRTNLAACSAPIAFGSPFTTTAFTSGTPPTELRMNIVLDSPPGFGNAVKRTHTITPTGGSGWTATLRLRYLDSELNGNTESALQLYRKDGANWNAQGASNRDMNANWVETAGVIQFSPWTLSAAPPGCGRHRQRRNAR